MGRIEVEVDLTAIESGDDDKPEWSIVTVQPSFQQDDKSETYFTQLQLNYGYQFGDTRLWSNVGVGYRRIINNNMLIGLNTFLDYDFEEQHLRPALAASSNSTPSIFRRTPTYRFPTKKTVSTTLVEEALGGYDLEARSQLPYLPWARAGLRYFTWNTESAADNITGYEATLEMDIHQNVQIEIAASDDNFGERQFTARLRFINRPNKRPAALSNKFVTARAFEPRDMRDYTLDKVRRENKIILEGKSSGIVIARGT